jgi:hypothetical protein
VKHNTIIALIAGLLSMASAHAHTNGNYPRYAPHYYSTPDRVDKRQYEQQKRITQGIESSRLTPRVLAKLDRQQDKIARLENRFKSDGWLSRKEKRILNKKLNAASQRIYRLKHNGRQYPVVHSYYADNLRFE